MKARVLTRTRQHLSGERERLIRLIGRSRFNAQEFDLYKTDDQGDLASASHDRELLYRLQEVERERLRVVGNAMKAMDRGDFGKCIVCAGDIGEKRIAAVPWAEMCVLCQKETEASFAADTSGA